MSICRLRATYQHLFGCIHPEVAFAGFRGCNKSFGYVRDNGLTELLRHSPEVDPNETFE